LNTSQMRNSYEFRNYQSLTSVLNSPSSRFFDSVVDFFSFSDTQPVPLMMIPHIEESDFKSFLNKIHEQLEEYLHKKNPRLSEIMDECTSERCFQVVPSFFFEETFDMRKVLEDLGLQEELNYFLDFTDVSLFRQIVDYWELFLKATHNLQSLEPEICSSLRHVRNLKANLANLSASMLPKSLEITKLHYRLSNSGKVLELLKLIAAVKETQPAVQQLLSTGHYASALDLIEKSKLILSTKLKGLSAMRNSAKELEGVQQMIERIIKEEVTAAAVNLIAGSVVNQREKVVKYVKSGVKSETEKLFTFDSDKFDEFSKLLSSKMTKVVFKEVAAQASTVIKEGFRSVASSLGVIKSDPEVSKWSVLSHAHVELVLEAYTLFIQQLAKRCEYVIENLQQKDQGSALTLHEQLTEFRRTLLKPLSTKLTKILMSRREIYTNASFDEIKAVNRLYLPFLDLNCKDFSLAIRSVLVQIEKDFLEAFHAKKSRDIANFLEGENWNLVEIPAEMLQLMEARRVEIANRAGIQSKSPQFSAVSATLMTYRILWEYVRIIEELEVPSEANSRMIEALKFFNSRSCQLVLGAGATMLGKVKTISSKTLGLSAQSLQFITTELKFIQFKVHWKLPDFQQVIEADYERVRSDFLSHERMIFEKLASILNERIASKCIQAKSIQWESMLSPEQLGKEYYSMQITADFTNMHSILQAVLNSAQMREVFTQVFTQLKQSLTELYTSIAIASSISAQRVVNDVQHIMLTFKEKVNSNLQDQVSALESSLEAVIGERCRPLL